MTKKSCSTKAEPVFGLPPDTVKEKVSRRKMLVLTGAVAGAAIVGAVAGAGSEKSRRNLDHRPLVTAL